MKKNPTNDKPLFRVSFSRIDLAEDGTQVVTRPKEIGAVWPRKNGKKGGILALDLIPIELTQRKGVLFILPVDADDQGGSL